MVQNVSNQQGASPYGRINRVGLTPDGSRMVYQVIDSRGNSAGNMSVPNKDADTFEKSYKNMMEAAPKIQKYVMTHSTEADIKRRKKTARWVTLLGGITGAAIPIFKTSKKSSATQIIWTILGTIAGLSAGFASSIALTTPPGTLKFARAAKNISKIDIRPAGDEIPPLQQ